MADALSKVQGYGQPEYHSENYLLANLANLGIPILNLQNIMQQASQAITRSQEFLGIHEHPNQSRNQNQCHTVLLLIQQKEIRDYVSASLRYMGHQVSSAQEPPDSLLPLDLTIIGPNPAPKVQDYATRCLAEKLPICAIQPELEKCLSFDEDAQDAAALVNLPIPLVGLNLTSQTIYNLVHNNE